jgi:hypothetical protein
MIDPLDGNKKLILHLGDVGSPCFEFVVAVTPFNAAFLIDLRHGHDTYRFFPSLGAASVIAFDFQSPRLNSLAFIVDHLVKPRGVEVECSPSFAGLRQFAQAFGGDFPRLENSSTIRTLGSAS